MPFFGRQFLVAKPWNLKILLLSRIKPFPIKDFRGKIFCLYHYQLLSVFIIVIRKFVNFTLSILFFFGVLKKKFTCKTNFFPSLSNLGPILKVGQTFQNPMNHKQFQATNSLTRSSSPDFQIRNGH